MTEEEKRNFISSHLAEIEGNRKKAQEAAFEPFISGTGEL